MLTTGQRVDRYVVEGKLGEGGMAVVYRVRHETLGTAHALKVLTLTAGDVRDRLVREGKFQAQLHNENVVQVTDVLTVGSQPGLLMEFVEGPSLEQWLTRYRPTPDEAASLFRGICAGVGYAHAKGLIHRDLKPSNVLLALSEDRMTPKVADFGLAKNLQKPTSGTTRSGSTMGTPGYMAPEQIRDASTVDRRADLWSLGCILYRLICGLAPFEGDDLIELFKQVASADFVSSRRLRPDLTDRVHRAIEQLLTVSIDERLGDCGLLIDWLDGKTNHLPATPREATLPTTTLPRWIPNDSEAADVARSIVQETLSHLPKLDRGLTSSPWIDSAAAESRSANQTITPHPSSAEELSYEAPVRHTAGRGMLLGASLVAAFLAAVVLVVLGGVGMFAIVRAGAPPPPMAVVTPREPLPAPEVAPPAPSPAPAPRPSPKGVERPSAPKPVTVAPAPPAPSEAKTGEVTFTGAEKLWLVAWNTTAEFHRLDELPPGRYRVHAVFADSAPAVAGEVTVRAGQTVSLTCSGIFVQCKP